MKTLTFLTAAFMALTNSFATALVNAGPTVTTDTTTASFRIIRAIEQGDLTAVKSLVLIDPSLIMLTEPALDDPLLVWAARKNQPAIVAFLLESGADINATNRLGSNCLHLAAFSGDYDLMALLFQKGADWKVRNQRGKIPIDYVSYGKNPGVFELFLSRDKNMLQEQTSDGSTLLHMAASAGDTAGFTFLLSRGLDIRATNNRGATVVHAAMEMDDLVMLKYLGQHGADLDAALENGFTPLFWAVMSGNREITLFLFENGADVNHRTNDGYTPLMMASRRDSLPMLELLLGKGADYRAANKEGQTALHLAVMNGNETAADFLAGRKELLNVKDHTGKTPLHYASIFGYAAIGQTLLSSGADPTLSDNDKHDAAWYCSSYGNKELGWLLQQKSKGNQKSGVQMDPLSAHLNRGNAVVHYLNHSGYAIETERYLLVFDYFHFNPSPTTPSLLNGRINTAEIKGKKVVVFASHEHTDHYDTTIWNWRNEIPDITYVMGFRPPTDEAYEYIPPHSAKTIGGVDIHTIRSTDSGEGFLVQADGLVIYHPGDHVNKTPLLSEEFTSEVDYLAGLQKKVDIAFFPVSGCGFPDLEAVKTGNKYVIEEMKPGICFSMHGDATACSGYSETICKTFPGQLSAFGTFPGDRFEYHSALTE